MSTPGHASSLKTARKAFADAGRGFIVTLDDGAEPRYGTLEELSELLEDEPEAVTLLAAVRDAVARYDPEHQAVVVAEEDNGITVAILRPSGAEIVGRLTFSPEH